MKKVIVFENVNLSSPVVDNDDDDDDDDDDNDENREKEVRDCVGDEESNDFTIPEWFLVRQLFVYSTTLRSGTNRLLAF